MDEIEQHEFEKLRKNLEELDCPLISDVDSCWIKEMIFRPGDSRMKFFEWLLMSISNQAFVKFKRISASGNQTSHSNAKYLVNVFSDLGYGDMAVIQGMASMKMQATFFNSLLNAIITAKQSACAVSTNSFALSSEGGTFVQPDVTLVHSSVDVPKSGNTKRPRVQYSAFIDTVVENEVLPKLAQSLPLDIQELLENRLHSKKGRKPAANVPTLSGLQSLVESSKAEIQKMDEEINNSPCTICPSEETIAKLCDVAHKVHQISSSYAIIHSNEIQPNCKQETPALSELGPTCFSLHENLCRLNNVNHNISQFKALQDNVKQHRQGLEQLVNQRGSYDNPGFWIHNRQVFQEESSRALKPFLNTLKTSSTLTDTFFDESAVV